MENDGLKDLFDGFQPVSGSDARFMDRLLDRMDAIETIRSENAALRRRNRTAMTIAAAAGFAAGVLFTLAFPALRELMTGVASGMSDSAAVRMLCDNYRLVGWSLCCVTAAFISVNTYEIASSLLSAKRQV